MRRVMAFWLLALALAGCGGSGGSAGADPATALPVAPVYLDLVVDPEGEQRRRMEALAAKLLRSDRPGAKILELLEDGAAGDFARDVEPWLGRRAGIALTRFDQDEPDYVVAVAAEDADRARESVEREAEREQSRRATHRDTDYWVDGDGQATGVAGDFVLVAASEEAMREAIDAQEGESLADTRRFEEAVGRLPEQREGTIFLDIEPLFDEAAAVGAAERQVFGALLGGAPPTAVAVLARPDELAFESRGPARSLPTLLGGLGHFGTTPLLGELPGDAVVAAGAPDLGETARQLFDAIAGPLGGAVVAGQLEEDLGISLERDVYSWMGDAALFVRGDAPEALGGGVVFEVRDRRRAQAALPKLLGALQLQAGLRARPVSLGGVLAFELSAAELPAPVLVALRGDRLVAGYGREAAEAALRPHVPLRDSDAWQRAREVLDGLDPSLVVDAPAALELAARAGAGDPAFARARPYLEMLAVLAAGSGSDGGERRSRLALGVRQCASPSCRR